MPLSTTAPGSGFLPHVYCYLWDKPLVLTHLTSDLVIGVSYVAISLSLGFLVWRARRDIPFSPLFIAFGLFIIACGMTHFMEVWTLWHPAYWVSAGVKVVTAVASVVTAAILPFTIPHVLAMIRDARLSHERALVAARNAALEESHERLQAQAAALAKGNAVLESQASELEAINAQLQEQTRALEEGNTMLHEQATELEEQRETAQRMATDLREALQETEDARQTALAANAAKSEFVAVMSHELRTPLNAIMGYCELLSLAMCGPLNQDQEEKLTRIRQSSNHLLFLINQVLDFERVAAGRTDPLLEVTDVGDLLRSTVMEIEPQALRKGLRVEIEPPESDITCITDAGKLRQILLNLLTNAVKYTERGGVRVNAGTEEGTLWLTVRDTGIGIKEEHQRRIFDPFWQADQRLTRTVGGTGLGLSIVQRFLQLLGGRITLSSQPGEGSTFTVTLPLAPEAQPLAA